MQVETNVSSPLVLTLLPSLFPAVTAARRKLIHLRTKKRTPLTYSDGEKDDFQKAVLGGGYNLTVK
jgi:hypothetical protein